MVGVRLGGLGAWVGGLGVAGVGEVGWCFFPHRPLGRGDRASCNPPNSAGFCPWILPLAMWGRVAGATGCSGGVGGVVEGVEVGRFF